MKAKNIRVSFLSVLLCCSIYSFVYLNFSTDNTKQPTSIHLQVQEDELDDDSTDVMSELALMKIIGKKLLEIVTI